MDVTILLRKRESVMKNRTILSSLRLVLVSCCLVVLSIFFLATGASAHTASAHNAAIPYAGAPIVKIVPSSNTYVFTPTKIHLFFQHSQFVEFDNTTNVTQVILNKAGKVIATISAGSNTTHHFLAKGTYVYHLQSNSAATVTIVLS